MKFVTNLSLEDCLTTESCNSTLAKFDQYMDEHPAIPAVRRYFLHFLIIIEQ